MTALLASRPDPVLPAPPLTGRLITLFQQHHPLAVKGLQEAIDLDPARFFEVTEMLLGWAVDAYGEDILAEAAQGFVDVSTDINLRQARYEREGRYRHQSFAEVYEAHYANDDTMRGYLWGSYLSNLVWAHHTDLTYFFLDRFARLLAEDARVLEVAPGHGMWGLLILAALPKTTLEGFDISPRSIAMASALADKGAKVGGRARYEERDALSLSSLEADSADAFICNMLVEHLEEPQAVFNVAAHALRPGGHGFISGALTAAQVDHIYEFKHESELVIMAEKAGLRVLETRSNGPVRRLRNARFTPRSMALIVRKS